MVWKRWTQGTWIIGGKSWEHPLLNHWGIHGKQPVPGGPWMETKPELELAARTTAFVCDGFNDFRQWNFSSILSNPQHFAGNHGGTSCGMALGMFIPPFFWGQSSYSLIFVSENVLFSLTQHCNTSKNHPSSGRFKAQVLTFKIVIYPFIQYPKAVMFKITLGKFTLQKVPPQPHASPWLPWWQAPQKLIHQQGGDVTDLPGRSCGNLFALVLQQRWILCGIFLGLRDWLAGIFSAKNADLIQYQKCFIYLWKLWWKCSMWRGYEGSRVNQPLLILINFNDIPWKILLRRLTTPPRILSYWLSWQIKIGGRANADEFRGPESTPLNLSGLIASISRAADTRLTPRTVTCTMAPWPHGFRGWIWLTKMRQWSVRKNVVNLVNYATLVIQSHSCQS